MGVEEDCAEQGMLPGYKYECIYKVEDGVLVQIEPSLKTEEEDQDDDGIEKIVQTVFSPRWTEEEVCEERKEDLMEQMSIAGQN